MPSFWTVFCSSRNVTGQSLFLSLIHIYYYVRHIIHNRARIEALSDTFIIPIVEETKFDQLFSKSTFYELCEKHGLDYPKCTVFDFAKDDIGTFKVPFEYPIFIKPSDSVAYAKYNFEDVYKRQIFTPFKSSPTR